MKKNLKKIIAALVVLCMASTQTLPVVAATTSNYQYWYTDVGSSYTNIANKKKVTTDNYSTASFWTGGTVFNSAMYAQSYYDGSACSSSVQLPKSNIQVQMVYTKTIGKGKTIVIKAKTSGSYMADGYHDVR